MIIICFLELKNLEKSHNLLHRRRGNVNGDIRKYVLPFRAFHRAIGSSNHCAYHVSVLIIFFRINFLAVGIRAFFFNAISYTIVRIVKRIVTINKKIPNGISSMPLGNTLFHNFTIGNFIMRFAYRRKFRPFRKRFAQGFPCTWTDEARRLKTPT
jgi:hypothetical protein